ncbi:MAG: amidohydrolase family protein [Clostridiaceae bacterium]|nr:amidohydrolase family protein [Clostridiaceae bacterium]
MIIDVHAHIWKGQYEKSSDVLIESADRYGIDRIYVSGLGKYVPDSEEVRELNDSVAKLMKRDRRIYGYCYINPKLEDAKEEISRGIEDLGMSGMKLWVAVYCDAPCVFPLVEQCIKYDVPVLIHAFHKATGQLPNETLGENVANLALKYPEARLIMAHLGANSYRELKPVRKCRNVWVDYSGTLSRRDELDYAKETLGAERILFGTDMDIASFLLKLGQLEDSSFTPEERELVLYKNALEIFKN